MSIFPFEYLEDAIHGRSSEGSVRSSSSDESSGSMGRESDSNYSESVMLSALSTESTIELTLMESALTGESQSVQTAATQLSIGDDGVVTNFPPGTLVQIYRDHIGPRNSNNSEEDSISAFSGTIIPSISPGGEIQQNPLATSSWSITSPPQQVHPGHGEALSISTTESIYRELSSLQSQNESSSLTHELSLSLHPSMINGSLVRYPSQTSLVSTSSASENSVIQTTYHDQVTFRNVADRLLLQTSSEGRNDKWFARFTEQDWLNFRHEADMILAALGSHDTQILALPPSPPQFLRTAATLDNAPEANLCASDVLPSTFICLLCDDVIVGACTLDCGCPHSTVCTSCREAHQTKCIEEDDELEYIKVELNSFCPFCERTVVRSVSCHALDVAILHCVKSLPNGHPIQIKYYCRLILWREEVLRRRSVIDKVKAEQRDKLLAEIIQREEEFFWKKKEKPDWKSNKKLMVLGEIALLAAAAFLTRAGGLKMFLPRG
mmetsp:Transcript_2141/g.3167  ORF Transcript_2141/g.3167 Transcript_2141/m.3167 type:complete len:494 (+) Transcript_2141:74-1555(+)|eukprot:CAMPEP_0194254522 /NCGR_PEP_ID=MMETSP0158-20130606/32341_1 /TAXON_ID=33649 /ORGANISM="Thalassionema nitzschioides, Strain L26-B" /LENGTH=493 /DNA_ID=CAMNT_0038992581 /DNA_START=15 /DNA_END=1496 /DNA_ORIENTATION=-